MNIGEKLKIAREAIGYTLKKASDESNIGESSISEFENSKREPKISQLNKLAEAYRKDIEFFFTDAPLVENVMLWRKKPENEADKKKVEAEFRQLCEQYYNLELCTGEFQKVDLEKVPNRKLENFSYSQVESLATRTRRSLNLGSYPSDALKRRLEEQWRIKIFYRDFQGSAISNVSDHGPAILLNRKNVEWRRNFSLAHELFHILTWGIFHTDDVPSDEPTDREETLADVFASSLLLPAEPFKDRMAFYADENDELSFDSINNIIREFGVSSDTFFWRLHNLLCNKSKEETRKHLELAKKLSATQSPRQSEEPDELPERYCHLAQRAIREGRLSLIQFAKYMGISYKNARKYLAEDKDVTDEKISITAT
jgi:Zn-dependent peptidase ImmA (M78 family)/DNA-binding XRE family transcriptional regulator